MAVMENAWLCVSAGGVGGGNGEGRTGGADGQRASQCARGTAQGNTRRQRAGCDRISIGADAAAGREDMVVRGALLGVARRARNGARRIDLQAITPPRTGQPGRLADGDMVLTGVRWRAADEPVPAEGQPGRECSDRHIESGRTQRSIDVEAVGRAGAARWRRERRQLPRGHDCERAFRRIGGRGTIGNANAETVSRRRHGAGDGAAGGVQRQAGRQRSFNNRNVYGPWPPRARTVSE